jgi:hypothetical protein
VQKSQHLSLDPLEIFLGISCETVETASRCIPLDLAAKPEQ